MRFTALPPFFRKSTRAILGRRLMVALRTTLWVNRHQLIWRKSSGLRNRGFLQNVKFYLRVFFRLSTSVVFQTTDVPFFQY